MAEVRPLRGIRYAGVSDLSEVVTPPFDVISPEAQARYYARHPHNVVRLELGQELPGDDMLNNCYTRAAATLSEWRLQGVLQQEAAPCFYFYQQIFAHEGQTYTRTNLLARVRLEPWDARVVLRHEHTRAKDKADRLNLLRACATNFSPIMSLYDDPQGRIRGLLHWYADSAEIQFVDEVGEQHRLQPVTDVDQIALIQDFFAQRQLYIADGHHRYETALAYRAEIVEQRKVVHPEDAVNFVLMALIDVGDPGMLVLPMHRLLFGLSQDMLSRLTSEQLGRYFSVQSLGTMETADAALRQLAGQEHPSLVIRTAEQTLLLTLNEQGQQRMEEESGSREHSSAWKKLDVAIAHTLVLEVLGLHAEDMVAGRYVRYIQDARETFESVQTGNAQVALLLNATRVRQICDVAQADDRMPPKSTYFYPKLMTGLVMNPLW